MMTNKFTYYFAYGSNLNASQLLHRCPNAIYIKKYILRGYKLVFDYYASIEYTGNQNDKVRGVIYALSSEDLNSLDRYEGVSNNCYRKTFFKLSIRGQNSLVLTYIKVSNGRSNPTKTYLNKIKRGYKFWGFDLSCLKNIETQVDISKKSTGFSSKKLEPKYIDNLYYDYFSKVKN